MQEAAVVFFVGQFQIGDEAAARGLCRLSGLRVVAALRDVAPVKADAAFLPGGQVVVVDAARVQQVVFFRQFEAADAGGSVAFVRAFLAQPPVAVRV